MRPPPTDRCPHCDGTGVRVRPNIELMKRKRSELGISLRKMASCIGISHSYLHDLEGGKYEWSEDIADRYCSSLTEHELSRD